MDWTIERLQRLRNEYASGQTQLAVVERSANQLREQLWRIQGAIGVLEEQLAAAPEFVGVDIS